MSKIIQDEKVVEKKDKTSSKEKNTSKKYKYILVGIILFVLGCIVFFCVWFSKNAFTFKPVTYKNCINKEEIDGTLTSIDNNYKFYKTDTSIYIKCVKGSYHSSPNLSNDYTGEHKEQYSLIKDADPDSFEILMQDNKIEGGADGYSFYNTFSRDKNYIYYNNTKVEEIPVSSRLKQNCDLSICQPYVQHHEVGHYIAKPSEATYYLITTDRTKGKITSIVKKSTEKTQTNTEV